MESSDSDLQTEIVTRLFRSQVADDDDLSPHLGGEFLEVLRKKVTGPLPVFLHESQLVNLLRDSLMLHGLFINTSWNERTVSFVTFSIETVFSRRNGCCDKCFQCFCAFFHFLLKKSHRGNLHHPTPLICNRSTERKPCKYTWSSRSAQ